MSSKRFLTTDQLAELLGLTKYAILAARRQDLDPLPALKFGRRWYYDRDEVVAWMKRQAKRALEPAR